MLRGYLSISRRHFSSMGDRVFGRVSVAVVTPFVDPKVDPDQPVDEAGFRTVIHHNASNLAKVAQKFSLVGGVIVSGTTGEQHCLTVEEKCRLYATAVEVAKPFNVPVVAGIAATTSAAVRKLTQSAIASGVEGIMLGLPPYVRLDDTEIRSYIMTVRDLTPSPDFPILLYNNSFRNGYSPSNELLVELCRSGVLWGIKHAPNPDDFKSKALALLEAEPSIRLYTGSDKMSISILNFGLAPDGTPRFYGLTSILGNLYPEEVAIALSHLTLSPPSNASANSSSSGNVADDSRSSTEKGEELYTRLLPAIDTLLVGTGLPVGLKYALRQKGLGGGYARLPIGNISEQKMADIDRVIFNC